MARAFVCCLPACTSASQGNPGTTLSHGHLTYPPLYNPQSSNYSSITWKKCCDGLLHFILFSHKLGSEYQRSRELWRDNDRGLKWAAWWKCSAMKIKDVRTTGRTTICSARKCTAFQDQYLYQAAFIQHFSAHQPSLNFNFIFQEPCRYCLCSEG